MEKVSITNLQPIEILAPAGSPDCFYAAVHAGADAVYVGGSRFGARAFAGNFSEAELFGAIDYAHLHGRKLYLTVNTLLKEQETGELYAYLEPLYRHGLDAVIVQDVGVLQFVKEYFPGLPIHASTQMTVTNLKGVQFLASQGASRVVLARELSLEEISRAAAQSNVEIECFVHGALCYCYSGQCLMSSMIGGRSGNRGQCAQPCRLQYEVDRKRKYYLSPKDICTLELIPELAAAGIRSFKIEGRMKKPEYVALVTAMYRKYVDLYLKSAESGAADFRVDPADMEKLADIYNRGGFHSGYYKQHNGADMLSLERPNHAGVAAVRIRSQKGREVCATALTKVYKGDILELDTGGGNYTFGKSAEKGEMITFLAPQKRFYKANTTLYRIRNQHLIQEIEQTLCRHKPKVKITGHLQLSAGKPATLTVRLNNIQVEVISGQIVDEAKTQPLSAEKIITQLKKTGNTELEFEDISVEMDGAVFIPMQKLNELRREALTRLTTAYCASFYREAHTALPSFSKADLPLGAADNLPASAASKPFCSIAVETIGQLRSILQFAGIDRIYIPDALIGQIDDLLPIIHQKGIAVFYAMPFVFRDAAIQKYESSLWSYLESGCDGILVRNCESFRYQQEHGFDKSVIIDHNLYVFNQYAKKFWRQNGKPLLTAPIELNKGELSELGLEDMELLIYGRIPVMLTAQCLQGTLGSCHQAELMLTDRMQKQFPVKNHCEYCYNVIYNSVPICLFDQMKQLQDLKPNSVRLSFTIEDEAETAQIMKSYLEKNTDMSKSFTRGHFKRGIS